MSKSKEPKEPRETGIVREAQEYVEQTAAAEKETGFVMIESPEQQREREAAERQEGEERLAELAREPDEDTARQQALTHRGVDVTLLGDFSVKDIRDGFIHIDDADVPMVRDQVRKLRKSAKFIKPLLGGTPIAAQYDIHVNNFSTHTAVLKLADGRRLFAVFAHKGSVVHRALDGIMKHVAGLRMGKVSRDKWKDAFLEHARIPQVTSDDPNTVLMPYIENVNAYDVIANNKEISNFGAIDWANNITPEGKNDALRATAREVKAIHAQGIAWGECILQNLILTKDKRAVMCDPEVRYDEGVPLTEAQARDLRDLLLSSCAALRKSEGVTDFTETVKIMLDEYENDEVIDALKKISHGKFSIGLMLTFWNEKMRTGVNGKEEYQEILKAIRNYER